MENYYIDGGVPLRGEYRIRGAKNSALPVLAATVCRGGVYEIYDCPRIGDVFAMEEILKALGARTRWERDCIIVDSRGIDEFAVPEDLMSEMRSSVFPVSYTHLANIHMAANPAASHMSWCFR